MPLQTVVNPTYRTIEVFVGNQARYKVQQWLPHVALPFGLLRSWGSYKDITVTGLSTTKRGLKIIEKPVSYVRMEDAIDFMKCHQTIMFWMQDEERGVGEPTARYFDYRVQEVSRYSRY